MNPPVGVYPMCDLGYNLKLSISNHVYQYTLEVCNAFAAANLPVAIISIGNEIRSGLLFPVGSTDHFDNIAMILHYGSRAVKNSNLHFKPKIMITMKLLFTSYELPL